MSLLMLENIVKEYRNQCVLNGVSLRIERGERVALVGPNGAGKTTLIKIAMGIEKSDAGHVSTARNIKVGYLSQDLKDLESDESPYEQGTETALHYEKAYKLEQKIRGIEKQMAELSQDTDSEMHQRLIKEYSRLLLAYEAMDGYTIETKIKKILVGLGLRQETLLTPLNRLSGGERMRVSVARILLEEPDLLILDEPTNHLDLHATEWFEAFLKKFNGGILFVSHDRYFLDRVATRVAELEKGSICVRSGTYSNYLEHKQQLSRFVSNEQKRLRWVMRSTKEKVQGLKSRGKIKASQSREKELKKLRAELNTHLGGMKELAHLHKSAGPKIQFKKVRHVSKDIARAENLKKSFGNVVLFSGASFHILGGERIGIIGPNGCGKSTLINMLLGKDKEYEGLLRLGEWVKYSYMGQEVLFENEEVSMFQLIVSRGQIQEREARDYLAGFQFYGDEVDKTIGVLSGGERVRLYLACAMLEEADCLILDEPTNHLDMPARDAVETALKEFQGTIITVTHDRYYLTHCVQKILEIDKGNITTYEGNYDFYKNLKYGPEEEATEGTGQVKSAGKNTGRSIDRGGGTNRLSNNEKLSREKARQALEDQITTLEEQIREIENSFNEDTPRETYQEYGELQKKVEQLYESWDALFTESLDTN